MHDKLLKMLGKKRDLSEHEKKAKMDVMHEMRNEAAHAMHGKLGGLKKVSVMADSHEGLKHGLEKAHDMLADGQEPDEQAMADGGVVSDDEESEMLADAENAGADAMHAHEEHDDEESPEHEASESPEFEAGEQEESGEMSEEEIDEQLQKLMEMKKRLGKS